MHGSSEDPRNDFEGFPSSQNVCDQNNSLVLFNRSMETFDIRNPEIAIEIAARQDGDP